MKEVKLETYKVELFDENTFKSKGMFDTQIPEILIKTIQESLDKIKTDLPRTELAIIEKELVPSFGIMLKDENGLHHLKYRVNISLFEQPKEIEKEQMYSEEEVLNFGNFCIGKVADFLEGKGDQTNGKKHSMEELFEEFKKK